MVIIIYPQTNNGGCYMKNYFITTILLLFVLSTIVIAQAALPITIDAQKDDWYNQLTGPDNGMILLPSRAFVSGIGDGPDDDDDLSAIFWSGWDDTYFYYYVEVKDDIILVNNSTKYENDNIEIKHDPDPSVTESAASGAIQTRITALSDDAFEQDGVDNIMDDANLMDLDGNASTWVPEVGVDYERAEFPDGDGYILEWRVPLDEVNSTTRILVRGVGEVFGMAINVIDNDDSGRDDMLQWSSSMQDAAWNNVTLHGSVTYLADGKLSYEAISEHTGDVNDSAAVWYGDIGVSVESNQLSNIPTAFSLEQNYPNPFNPTTKIRYNLNKTDNVSLTIYNISGEVVNNLIANQTISAGTYEVDWNGKNNSGFSVASGMYFYRLTQGLAVSTKKMVLLR